MDYVWVVHERLEPLVDAFNRLWLLDRMLRISRSEVLTMLSFRGRSGFGSLKNSSLRGFPLSGTSAHFLLPQYSNLIFQSVK